MDVTNLEAKIERWPQGIAGSGVGSGFWGGRVVSGCCEVIERARWSTRRCSGGQAEMGEDPGHGRWTLDSGYNLQLTATEGTVSDIDIKHPFE